MTATNPLQLGTPYEVTITSDVRQLVGYSPSSSDEVYEVELLLSEASPFKGGAVDGATVTMMLFVPKTTEFPVTYHIGDTVSVVVHSIYERPDNRDVQLRRPCDSDMKVTETSV